MVTTAPVTLTEDEQHRLALAPCDVGDRFGATPDWGNSGVIPSASHNGT